MEFGDVKEEYGNEKRKTDGRDKIPVETMLQYRYSSGPKGEEIEPLPVRVSRTIITGQLSHSDDLHYDQVDEVYRASHVQDLRVSRSRHTVWYGPEPEPQSRERYTIAFCVPVAHCKRCQRLNNADKSVRL